MLPSFFEELGSSEDKIFQLVDVFYDRIAQDPILRPLFPEDLTEAKVKQSLFFIEYFGGPPRYSEKYGKAFLRFKHRHAVISHVERDAWLGHIEAAMTEIGVPTQLVADIMAKLRPMAEFMENSKPGVKDAQYFNTPNFPVS